MTVRRGKVHDQSDDPTIPHGTAGGYNNHRCNCVDCRRANAAQQSRYRKAHPERDPLTGRLWTDPPRTKVTDEMVERALSAYWKSSSIDEADSNFRKDIRAALEAALNPKQRRRRGVGIMTEIEDAPTWNILGDVVGQAQYRPGWRLALTDVARGEEHGLRLDVYSLGYDTYHPDRGETYRVRHSFIVPAASYNERSWTRWLFDRLVDIETHEAAEFFRLELKGEFVKTDGSLTDTFVRRPFAPNHGPGHDPYMVRELNRVEDAETTFRGKRREGTQ